MKVKMLFLAAALLVSCGRRSSRPALVPEISPPLVQEEVCAWKGRLAWDVLFPCAGGIGWIDAQGRIVAWDAVKKATAVLKLPFRGDAPPFRQGNLLVLRESRNGRLLVIDLEKPAVLADLEGLHATALIGVDAECLVYSEGGRLTVNFWRRPGAVFRDETVGTPFFNSHFSAERILILTAGKLTTFWKKSGRFASVPLPQPAISPFACDGEHMYYGSAGRGLLKYSIRKNRLVWKLKLGQPLNRQPLVFSGSVVASPADNNLLLVNGRGSVRWWLALQSILSSDLVSMNDHLSAVLLNREIKFIHPRRKTVTVFKGRGNPASRPLAFNRDLYFMLQDEETCRLQRVGNHYAVEVELDPAKLRWRGQSIRFSIQSRNLIKPSFEILIRDQRGQTVFSKSAAADEPLRLVWIPLQPGRFTVNVTAQGSNRRAEAEVAFQVLDPLRPLPAFKLHF